MAGPCPVEFGYLYPSLRGTNLSNIHNHPIHADAKMCSKVKESIAEAIMVNPTIISLLILIREKVLHLFQV